MWQRQFSSCEEFMMYQLRIRGPKGWRTLRWDPRKLARRDPKTMALLAEADQMLKEAINQNSMTHKANSAFPSVAASGRWID